MNNDKNTQGVDRMKKIRVAVVGLGFVGVLHVEALRRLGNIEVVAICDSYQAQKKAKQLYIEAAYDDFKKMIDEVNPDFIHICTPNVSHYDIAKYALNHGVNVVLEKPMTYTIEQARELYYLAKDKHLINAVNFHNRLYPAPAYIKSMIQKDQIGDVFSVNGHYVQDWMLFETDYSWRLNSSESGKTRVIADIGSHWIDLVEYMTGLEVVEVLADFKILYETRKKAIGQIESFNTLVTDQYEDIKIDTEDVATLLLRFSNGALGNAIFSQACAGKKNEIEVLISGKKASLQWSLDTHSDVKIGYRNKPNEIITKDFLLMKEVSNSFDYPAGHTEGYGDAFKQVFKNVYHESKPKLYANFYDGLRQMIINEKIYQSAKTSSWVKIGKTL